LQPGFQPGMLRCTMADAPFATPALEFRPEALFRPRSLVLIADPALPEASILARNIAAGGFQGSLFAVGAVVPGATVMVDIASLPSCPDLAVLALAPADLEPALLALAARGCRAAIVIGASPDLGAITARTGIRAYGQGSFGIAVPAIGLNATLSHLPLRPGRLALVTQSAALARAVVDWAVAEAVGFSHIIGVGGNASIGFAVALDWLSRDSGTGAVLLDIRRIRDRRAFLSAARATTRTHPVVALRAGARRDDASGISDAVMAAALRRAGVLRVEGLGDLLTAAEILARLRLRAAVPGGGRGDRIAIVTNGLGLGHLAADAVLTGGGQVAALPDAARTMLAAAMPGKLLGNPLALGPTAGVDLATAAACLARQPDFDCVIALHAPSAGGDDAAVVAALTAANRDKPARSAPILVGWCGEATARAQRDAMEHAGLAVFATPEAAARAALQLAEDRANRAAAAELPSREVLRLAPDRAAVRRLFAAVRGDGRSALTDAEALSVLGAYGLPSAPGRPAAGPREAADAAIMLGFPVALKIQSPDLPSKVAVGGVALGLASADAVQAAAEAMQARIAAHDPVLRCGGFLVQRQAAAALELRLRLDEDAMFGPWIGFGLGGAFAGMLADEAFDLPPLNLALAQQLIGRARIARLLDGTPGVPPVNRAAIADALVRLSQIAVDFPEIAGLCIDPLLVDARGVLAIDARLSLRPDGEQGVLAVPPYPAELADEWRNPAGEVFTIRPIRPEDAEAHAAFIRALDPQDLRFRFFAPIRELSREMTARLTQIDYDREMAFVALRQDPQIGETMLGIARLIREPNGQEAEYALIVAPAAKGQGLARHLMERLMAWGRTQGVREMVGQVLADNAPMLGFVRRLGFSTRRSLEDAEVIETRFALG
jgi:acetyltransferase